MNGSSQLGVLPGRDEQREALDQASSLAAGGTPQVVILEGVPGMGKTALLDAFAARPTASWNLVRVTCDRFEVDVGFGLAGILAGEWFDASASAIAVGRRLLEWLGQLQRDTDVAVVLLDDVQWMDRQSADALRFAVRRLRADRVLVVLGRRPPGSDDPWEALVTDSGLCARVVLPPLDVRAVMALAMAERSWELDAPTADRLVRDTGGLPLLVKAILLSGSNEPDLASPIHAPTASAQQTQVPAPAVNAVQRMLRNLDPPACRLLDALAVLGGPATLIALGDVSQVPDPAAALTAALQTPVIRRIDECTIDFVHALFRDVVYERIPLEVRRHLHSRAAAWTTGDTSLRHRFSGTDRTDAPLAADLETAATANVTVQQFATAASQFHWAATVAPERADRDRLLQWTVVCQVKAHNLVGARALQTDLDASAPGAVRSLAVGLLMREIGRAESADSWLTEAVRMADAVGDTDLAVRACIERATMHLNLLDWPAMVAAAGYARTAPDSELAAEAALLYSFGLWFVGRQDEARRRLNVVPDAIRGTVLEAEQCAARGIFNVGTNDLFGARRDLNRAVQLAHTWRPSVLLDQTYSYLAVAHSLLGDWDAASVAAANAVGLAQSGEQPWLLPMAHAISAAIPAARGQWETAEDHLARARQSQRIKGSIRAEMFIALSATILATARTDWPGVIETTSPLMSDEVMAQLVASSAFGWVMTARVQALIGLRRVDEASACIAQYQAMLAGHVSGGGPSRVGWLRGLLAQARGSASEAREHFAADMTDPLLATAPFEKAQLLLSLGELELAIGSRREAIDRLRDAHMLLTKLRAAPLIERCDAALAASGMPTTSNDRLALSAREQDVATLIARGLSNGEAAAELYVTTKTVEYHLGNIYAKLGITGRKQLRTQLARA